MFHRNIVPCLSLFLLSCFSWATYLILFPFSGLRRRASWWQGHHFSLKERDKLTVPSAQDCFCNRPMFDHAFWDILIFASLTLTDWFGAYFTLLVHISIAFICESIARILFLVLDLLISYSFPCRNNAWNFNNQLMKRKMIKTNIDILDSHVHLGN